MAVWRSLVLGKNDTVLTEWLIVAQYDTLDGHTSDFRLKLMKCRGVASVRAPRDLAREPKSV
jgi:hypothetical protein